MDGAPTDGLRGTDVPARDSAPGGGLRRRARDDGDGRGGAPHRRRGEPPTDEGARLSRVDRADVAGRRRRRRARPVPSRRHRGRHPRGGGPDDRVGHHHAARQRRQGPGQRRAQGSDPSRRRGRQHADLPRLHRTRGRLRRLRLQDPIRPRRRRVGGERTEDVHHLRPPCRLLLPAHEKRSGLERTPRAHHVRDADGHSRHRDPGRQHDGLRAHQHRLLQRRPRQRLLPSGRGRRRPPRHAGRVGGRAERRTVVPRRPALRGGERAGRDRRPTVRAVSPPTTRSSGRASPDWPSTPRSRRCSVIGSPTSSNSAPSPAPMPRSSDPRHTSGGRRRSST